MTRQNPYLKYCALIVCLQLLALAPAGFASTYAAHKAAVRAVHRVVTQAGAVTSAAASRATSLVANSMAAGATPGGVSVGGTVFGQGAGGGSATGSLGGIPLGFFMQPYTATLLPAFGKPPYTFALVSGGLPPGITMNSVGKIAGKPGDIGKFSFQVKVTDSSKPPASRLAPVTLSIAIGLDTYGGLTALRSQSGPSGFFRMEKTGGRWNLVSPQGNVFYLQSVFNANEGFIEPAVLQQRYGGDMDQWAAHRGQRMLSWGFNVLGEYTAERGLPVGTWGGQSGNPVKLPFILLMNTVADSQYHFTDIGLPEPIKNITSGTPSFCTQNYCGGLFDVFDPKWAQGYKGEVALRNKAITGGFASVPWIVGITTEDADYFWALKGTGDNPIASYPHPSYLIATAMFTYTAAQNPNGQNWIDSKLYSKYAWVNFLQQKYGTVQVLNSAWGSKYTSFGDQGGFGAGTGVLDEDGRHTAWLGSDPYMLNGANANLKADMDAFLYQYAYQLESAAVNAIRSDDKNHLIFAPSALGGLGAVGVRPQVLKAFADAGVDAFAIVYDPLNPQNIKTATGAYDLTSKPSFLWYGVTANNDSYWHGYPGDWYKPDYPTQQIRGQHYASDQQVLFTAKALNGDFPVLGIDFWSLTDSGAAEQTNFGLMSDKDNAYDGKCAVMAPSKDQWGYACGGETANYGDFLDEVTQTNSNTCKRLIVEKAQ